MDRLFESLLSVITIVNHFRTPEGKQNQRQVKRIGIDALPDDVLLGIFDSYSDMSLWYGDRRWVEAWQSLVHVCRRWRNLVLASPRRLNLRLYCTPNTPAKDTLNIWPALPLIVNGNITSLSGPDTCTDNITAALRQSNRILQVNLHCHRWQLENILDTMQVPFPELTKMQLISRGETPAIPDSFLDGSAPSLQDFELDGIPFPGLPRLLLSANHLVILRLIDIPHSGYIPPEAMLILLSALSSLDTLHLTFQSPQSCPDRQSRSLPSPKRSILPLRTLHFKGVTEYLEELVVGIDAPQLDKMLITFFNQIDFDCSRLALFIDCTPTLRSLDEARVRFDDGTASIKLRYWSSQFAPDDLGIEISCREPDWQLSSIEQVSNSFLRPLSTVEDLYILCRYWRQVWKNDAVQNTLWLQLFLRFTAVKNLYLSKVFAPDIVAALEEAEELVGSRITEVLPSLENIFVEALEPLASGRFQEKVGRFVAARQLSDHPIVISDWDNGSDTELM